MLGAHEGHTDGRWIRHGERQIQKAMIQSGERKWLWMTGVKLGAVVELAEALAMGVVVVVMLWLSSNDGACVRRSTWWRAV